MTATWPTGLPIHDEYQAASRHELHERAAAYPATAPATPAAPGLVGVPPELAAEAMAHVRRLQDHGWHFLPLPLADFDLQVVRHQGGYVDVLLLGPFGHAVLARYLDAHEPGISPFAFQGRQVRREQLPSIEALRRAVGVTEPGVLNGTARNHLGER